jgi:hypothetical protein
MGLLNSTEVKSLTLEQLTIRVLALEKVMLALLDILGGADGDTLHNE